MTPQTKKYEQSTLLPLNKWLVALTPEDENDATTPPLFIEEESSIVA